MGSERGARGGGTPEAHAAPVLDQPLTLPRPAVLQVVSPPMTDKRVGVPGSGIGEVPRSAGGGGGRGLLVWGTGFRDGVYRGTSLIRNTLPVGPYSRPMTRALWWS